MSIRLLTGTRHLLTCGEEIGKGGEASVYRLQEDPALVAKLYKPDKRTPEREAKLEAMIQSRPRDRRYMVLPAELVYNAADGLFAGYLMRRIDGHFTLPHVYQPGRRREILPHFTYRSLLEVSINLWAAVSCVHRGGHVIGDLNSTNILVSPQQAVLLIDTDSFQYQDPRTGNLFPCPVGKADYCSPRVQRDKARRREPADDYFSAAVLTYQLLMEGVHPYEPETAKGRDPIPIGKRIQQGLFPNARPCRENRSTSSLAPPFAMLSSGLQELFRRTFVEESAGAAGIPDVDAWIRELDAAVRGLVRCSRVHSHELGRHLQRCPWCERAAESGFDSFADAVSHGSSGAAGPPLRRAPSPPGLGSPYVGASAAPLSRPPVTPGTSGASPQNKTRTAATARSIPPSGPTWPGPRTPAPPSHAAPGAGSARPGSVVQRSPAPLPWLVRGVAILASVTVLWVLANWIIPGPNAIPEPVPQRVASQKSNAALRAGAAPATKRNGAERKRKASTAPASTRRAERTTSPSVKPAAPVADVTPPRLGRVSASGQPAGDRSGSSTAARRTSPASAAARPSRVAQARAPQEKVTDLFSGAARGPEQPIRTGRVPEAAGLAALLQPQAGFGTLLLRGWESGDVVKVGERAESSYRLTLPVGTHKVEVMREGRRHTEYVTISPGREVEVTLPTGRQGWN